MLARLAQAKQLTMEQLCDSLFGIDTLQHTSLHDPDFTVHRFTVDGEIKILLARYEDDQLKEIRPAELLDSILPLFPEHMEDCKALQLDECAIELVNGGLGSKPGHYDPDQHVIRIDTSLSIDPAVKKAAYLLTILVHEMDHAKSGGLNLDGVLDENAYVAAHVYTEGHAIFREMSLLPQAPTHAICQDLLDIQHYFGGQERLQIYENFNLARARISGNNPEQLEALENEACKKFGKMYAAEKDRERPEMNQEQIWREEWQTMMSDS